MFGLGCLPHDVAALERIVELKRRNTGKGFILIAASLAQAEVFAVLPDGDTGAQLRQSWPGPVTWILPAQPELPALLTGGRDTVAIRVTAHPIARALCLAAGGALVSTSANVSGHEPITDRFRLRRQLGRDIDMIVPGALGKHAKPTAIRDGGTGAVIRAD